MVTEFEETQIKSLNQKLTQIESGYNSLSEPFSSNPNQFPPQIFDFDSCFTYFSLNQNYRKFLQKKKSAYLQPKEIQNSIMEKISTQLKEIKLHERKKQ